MSQAEFDSYLSLLSKFLRLRSRQRAELADELRDHLDSRLDELLAQGKTREQAIQIALEEFGDAAVLAEDFSRLATRRKRRFVMRCTAASAAVVAAVVLLSVAFAPPGPNGPGPREAIAQATEHPEEDAAGAAAEAAADLRGTPRSIEQEAVAELDHNLGKIIPEIKFTDTPLREIVSFVADSIEADALIDENGLTEEGLTADDPVTLSLSRTRLSARTVLDFVLQPFDLTFVNRAGVIYVTTNAVAKERLTTKVYNVRDLLENAVAHSAAGANGGSRMGTGGGGFFSVTDIVAAAMATGEVGQIGGGGGGGGGLGGGSAGAAGAGGMAGVGTGGGIGTGPGPMGPDVDLIAAIEHSTSGAWMDIDGTGGTLSLFNGLLVVRQTDEVQDEVQKLLDAMREAGAAQPGGSVTIPKSKEATTDDAAAADHSPAWRILGLKLGPATGKEGLKITEVRPDGPAAELWFIRQGDVLVGLGKWNVRNEDQLAIALEHVKEWDAAQVLTVRGRETLMGNLPIHNK